MVVEHYRAQLRRDWKIALPAFLLPGIGETLVFYVPPLIVANVLARFGESGTVTLGELRLPIILFATAWFAGEMSWRLGAFFMIKLEGGGMQRLYKNAMAELLRKDLAFFHDNFAGSLTKKALGYARSYEGVVDTLVFTVVGSMLPLLFVGPVLWFFSPWLVLVLVAMTALTGLAITPLIRRRQRLVDAREAASNVLSGHVSDSIMNVEAVRAFAREDHEMAKHAANVDDYIAKAKRSWNYQNQRIDMVTSPLYVATNVFGLMLAVALSSGGVASLEAVFITFSFYVNFTRLMWEFNHIYRNLETHVTEAAQFTQLLLEPPAVTDPPTPTVLAPVDASVSFRDVLFRYHDDEGDHLFAGFNLDIASGEKVGLVGRSGGGKTTVTRLLLRFMDIDAGTISVGGQDITTLSQTDLRQVIGYVPQDPMMFHRTVADNIRFGRLEASDDEVRAAAEAAHAASFIDELPNGYDTLIGERGVKLSGGQRQRIAIARAMLKAAPILVLDEATSSLDSESEMHIQAALWDLMEGRTAIVIAHRLSTVQRMDRLVVLDEGRIIEQGSHAELLARGGMYADLWARQSGGFLRDEQVEPVG